MAAHITLSLRPLCLLAALVLALPVQAASYTVKPGDTLWRVASAHGTSVETLRKLNRLKGNSIAAGQRLTLPAATQPKPVAQKVVTQKITLRKTAAQQAATQQTHAVKAPAVSVAINPALQLASSSAMVVDAETGHTLYAKNADQTKSIASITKLMTAMVVLDARPSMQEVISISDADVDQLKHTSSRLPVGAKLTRYEMLRLALMSSENRASSALSRHYPGGRQAFINAMNNKAARLAMTHTRFQDPTGLTPANVSTAEDLVKMVRAASQYELIREFSTTPGREVALRPHSTPLHYKNSNALVRAENSGWDIKLSKTGYIQEAGRCLVMMANVAHRPAVLVFLEADGKLSPVGDANRVKDWMESGRAPMQLASR